MARVDNQPTVKNPRAVGAIIIISLAMLSAAPAVVPDDFVRQGNQAVERGDYEEAVRIYQQAQERAADPGLVAFNLATAYYHLHDFRNAENHYRMALDDAAIPAERRSKALYNLGNCLVRQAGDKDVKILRDAIRCFELCLDSGPSDDLRGHAAFNLELAKVLWNKARATMAEKPPPNQDNPPDEAPPPERKKKQEPKKSDDPSANDSSKDGKKQKDQKFNADSKSKIEGKSDDAKLEPALKPSPSRVPVLADKDKLEPLSPETTRSILQKAEARLKAERLRNRADIAVPETPSGRDW